MFLFGTFENLNFEFVSDFDIRISNFSRSENLLDSGYAGSGVYSSSKPIQ